MLLNPYLQLPGRAREAMEHYRSVFGGELEITTFAESGQADGGDGVMHAQLVTPHGMTLMASDTPEGYDPPEGASVALSLSGDEEEELRGFWDGLVAGGDVTMPLAEAPWGDVFGMCTDRFGVSWMVNITRAGAHPS